MRVADFKHLYEQELELQDQLQSAANTPISIVTLICGGIVLMMKGFDADAPGLYWTFWSGAAAATILIGIAISFLVRSLHGYRYERIPYASELAHHHELLRDFYRRQGRPGAAPDAFEQYLVTRYIAATDANAKNNLRRGEYLQQANRYLVYGLCCTAAAAVPAGIATKSERPQAQDVRIINLRSDGNALLQEWSGTGARSASTRNSPTERGRSDR